MYKLMSYFKLTRWYKDMIQIIPDLPICN